MAHRRSNHHARQTTHRYLVGDGDAHQAVSARDLYDCSDTSAAAANLEFDESEVVWHSASATATLSSSPGNKLVMMRSSSSKKPSSSKWATTATSSSAPVNIPDWSKILRRDYYKQMQQNRRNVSNQERNNKYYEDDEEEEGVRVPPHEFAARNRVATSFSVHEGNGRTLKGRDLNRVRDAIWEKIGFQD